MKKILNQLYEYKTLTASQAKQVLIDIAELKYSTSEVASFLSIYLMRSITVDELAGFRGAMMDLCLKIEFEKNDCMDIVGTGGDNKNTFNISTLSCFVVAASGIHVTKHGNYGVSSVSGSSNVLEALGYKFTSDSSELNKQLDKTNLCFLHAPLFHPAMKSVASIRKELGVRTFFNLLGPLVNPSNPSFQTIGVYNSEILRLYNYLLQTGPTTYTLLHSFDGYDEISLTGKFKCVSNKKEEIHQPHNFNLQELKEKDLFGGVSINDSKKIFLDILNGNGTQAQNTVVIINAAFAIQTVKQNLSISECYLMAEESLKSKKALSTFKKLIN